MKYYTSTTEFNCGIDLHARQMAVKKRLVSDAGDVGGNRDAGQVVANKERPVTDVGDRDAGQAAAGERILSDAGDVGADDNARDAGGVIERLVPKAGDRQASD